jgi:RimJ/RimL family protein N-acetyltransferase
MTQPVRSSEQPGDTERLLFRRLRADDIELRLDLDSDPEVMRFLTGGRARTAEYEQAVVARVLDEYVRGWPVGATIIGVDRARE